MVGSFSRYSDDEVERLVDRIVKVERRADELERPTGTQVAQAVAELQATIARIVTPDTKQTSVGSFNTTTSQGVIATLTFTVPEGCTRALVFAVGSVTTTNFSGSASYLYTRLVIAGNAGPEASSGVKDFNTSPYSDTLESTACAHAFIATGLTPGGTFTVQLTTRSSVGTYGTNASNNATLVAQALYLP